jgi:hypothetical protein
MESSLLNLEKGDILLSKLKNPILKDTTIILTGSHIAHNAQIIDSDNAIDAELKNGIRILPINELLSERSYYHVHSLRDDFFTKEEKEKIIKDMCKQKEQGRKYSASNVVGHLVFNIFKNIEEKTNKKLIKQEKDIDKDAFLYNSRDITCSQMLFRAIFNSLDDAKKEEFYKLIGNDDIRCFYPTRIPKITKYKFTIFPKKEKQRECLSENERNRLDTSFNLKWK